MKLLQAIPGHHLTVTPFGPVTFVDCTCSAPPTVQHPSTRAAERAALRHYIAHAPDGPDREQATDLLEQITTTQKEDQP